MKSCGRDKISAALVREHSLKVLELLYAHAPPPTDEISRASYLFAVGNAYGMLMAASGYARDKALVHPVGLGYDLAIEMRGTIGPEDLARSLERLRAVKRAMQGDSSEN